MDKPRTNRAGLIVAIVLLILLLLPVLYVGSYFALVVPEGEWIWHDYSLWRAGNYRAGTPRLVAKLFWPLEQIDRKVRPERWVERYPSPFDE